MYEKWLDIVKNSPLFDRIDTGSLGAMLECMRPKIEKYKKNEYIVTEGENFEGIGILLTGNASVTKENAAGSRIIVTMLEPSNMFGEIAAFSKHKLWPATVVAQENSTVMFLPPEKIVSECEKLCFSHKTLVNNMLRIVSDRALMLNKKLEYITIKSMRGKISCFLLDEYKRTGTSTFMMPMNRNELADFLNVSRPSLSREMGRMKDEGLIDYHRSSIRIKDLESLKSMSV